MIEIELGSTFTIVPNTTQILCSDLPLNLECIMNVSLYAAVTLSLHPQCIVFRVFSSIVIFCDLFNLLDIELMFDVRKNYDVLSIITKVFIFNYFNTKYSDKYVYFLYRVHKHIWIESILTAKPIVGTQ